ncbi:DUF4956 domain-containing protein [Rudanella lutea]|uniref:DUF4956 domain-containing protein n=1 Tax=Rudanella lutea TaxID=451374 RepID=UPI0003A7A32F|nr:DUF4956 domain-containing protein [Rudanella lutea]
MCIAQVLSDPEWSQSLFAWTGISGALLTRLLIDLATVGVLIGLVYYRIYRKTDLFLTFFGFNLIIFLITHLLNEVQLSMGAAFGLFAVFSMLRYRTEGLTAKDMTYLFIVISLGLISAVIRGGMGQLLLLNALILGCVYGLESGRLIRREWSKPVHYDRLDLLQPSLRPELLHDLRARTGLPVHRVDIQEFDLLKDCVKITVYYYQDATTLTSVAAPADSMAR